MKEKKDETIVEIVEEELTEEIPFGIIDDEDEFYEEEEVE